MNDKLAQQGGFCMDSFITVSLGIALFLSAPFLAIGIMVYIIRRSGPTPKDLKARVQMLEQNVTELQAELNNLREFYTQSALSNANAIAAMRERFNLQENCSTQESAPPIQNNLNS